MFGAPHAASSWGCGRRTFGSIPEECRAPSRSSRRSAATSCCTPTSLGAASVRSLLPPRRAGCAPAPPWRSASTRSAGISSTRTAATESSPSPPPAPRDPRGPAAPRRAGAGMQPEASGVGAEVAEAIPRSPAREHLAICSFSPDEIRAAKRARPEVPCILLFQWQPHARDPIEATLECGADGADLPWPWLDEPLARRVHDAGLLLGGGTANDAAAVDILTARRADFVDSDKPRATVRARDAAMAR